jgi:hypothetical protein
MTKHTYTIPDGVSVWDDDEQFPIEDWRSEVINDDTRLGYWEWVYHGRQIALDEDEVLGDSQ